VNGKKKLSIKVSIEDNHQKIEEMAINELKNSKDSINFNSPFKVIIPKDGKIINFVFTK
jgi:hypothetical protein